MPMVWTKIRKLYHCIVISPGTLAGIKLMYREQIQNQNWATCTPDYDKRQRDTFVCVNNQTPLMRQLKIEYTGGGILLISEINVYGSGMYEQANIYYKNTCSMLMKYN